MRRSAYLGYLSWIFMFAIQCLPVIRTICYKTMDVINNADTEMTIPIFKICRRSRFRKIMEGEKFETFRNKSELEEIGSQFYSTSKPDGIIIYRAMCILHDATRVS